MHCRQTSNRLFTVCDIVLRCVTLHGDQREAFDETAINPNKIGRKRRRQLECEQLGKQLGNSS